MTHVLDARDAAILDKLMQVVAIARRNHWGTAADVQRVAEAHLPNPHTLRRALLNERARADQLAVENHELRSTIRRLRDRLDPHRTPARQQRRKAS